MVRAHGGTAWTPEALRRIRLAKSGGAIVLEPTTSSASASPTAKLYPPAPAILPAIADGSDAAVAAATLPAAAARPSTSLYTAVAAYEAHFEAEAKSGQVSEGRWANVVYAMRRLKFAVPDRPRASMGFAEIRTVVNYFTARPVTPRPAASSRRTRSSTRCPSSAACSPGSPTTACGPRRPLSTNCSNTIATSSTPRRSWTRSRTRSPSRSTNWPRCGRRACTSDRSCCSCSV